MFTSFVAVCNDADSSSSLCTASANDDVEELFIVTQRRKNVTNIFFFVFLLCDSNTATCKSEGTEKCFQDVNDSWCIVRHLLDSEPGELLAVQHWNRSCYRHQQQLSQLHDHLSVH